MVSAETITDGNSFSSRSAASNPRAKYSSFLYRRKLASLLIAFAFVLSFSLPTEAATITVSGTCSLADAITAANTDTATGGCPAGSGADTIRLTAHIVLDGALPSISSAITIEGAGSRYAIDGVDTYQIFFVETSGNLTVNRLALTRGTAAAGGAIQSNGTLSVNNSFFTNNNASTDGGAILGKATISNSIFTGNEAVFYGGAFFDGTGGAPSAVSNISNTVFSNNSAGIGGGAIEVRSRININGSAFFSNEADDEGGAISNASRGTNEGIGMLSVINSTFSDNYADEGSAIATGVHGVGPDIGNAVATLTHVTVSENLGGSAVYNEDSLNIHNSIIYNNSPSDCAGTLATNTRNIIGSGTCGTPYSTIDPQLGGIPEGSLFYPLLAGSPAIDAADRSQCPSGDQRGTRRPQGAGCDIGAYEFGGSSGNGGSRPNPAPQSEPETENQQTVQQSEPETENQQTVQHNEQMITEHDYGVTTQYGLQTISLRPLNPQDCGAIGNQAVCDMDVLDVADISGWAEQGVRFCFPQHGRVLFLPSHDANGQPINQKTAQPEELPVEIIDGMTCVTINRTGKLVLVRSDAPVPPTIITQTQQEPEPVWEPVPVTQCGHRTQADGSVVHVVQSGHHCWAIAEACGIYLEDIQRLNPGFGDCRMLHPGDELVVSAPPSPTDGVSMSVDEIPYDDPEYISMEGRVSLGVARCMRDIAQDHRAVSFAMVKRETRRIAEEAWRNRGSDHWTAQLGDGRLTVSRKLRRRTQGGGGLITIYSPVCTAMRPDLDFMYLQEDSESLAEESLEALRHAIADMLRVCEVRYAVAEREAEKIARAAARDGVRGVHELPVYRAMGLGFRYTDSASSEKEAAKTECFGLPDGSYLEDWGDHGDKDQLFNEQQIEDAEAQLEASKYWAVAACDIATTAGASVVIEGATITAKEIVKETLTEAAKLAVAIAIENAPGEEASERTKIFADFAAGLVKNFPTGPCSAFMVTFEYSLLLAEMKEALANLEEGQGVDDLDVFGEDIYCEIYSTDTVLAKGDPDPNRDGTELRLDASDAFSPLGTVEHNGEKYYVVQGTRGRGTKDVGGLITAALYNKSENRGHAFVPVSNVEATDSCKDLPDATSLYAGAAHPQDLIGRELVDLNVQEVPDAFAKEDCKFSMDIDPDRLYATDLLKIEPESMGTGFSVFTLCETHDGSSCHTVTEDNEFVITHYDRINRRVYVKSLDDDGKPEGWLMRENLSARYIPNWLFGRQLDQTTETEHWIDPDQFNPENVTDGSSAYGNTAMCLPQ